MDEFDLGSLLDETDGMENSETPPLAPASDPSMFETDNSGQTQEPAQEDSAAEVDQASETTNPEPPLVTDAAPDSTSSGGNDLGDAPDVSSRAQDTANAPAEEDGSIPLSPRSSSPEPYDQTQPPQAADTPDWPDIPAREIGMAPLGSLGTSTRRVPSEPLNDQAGSPQMSSGSPIQPVFNIQVTAGDDLSSRLYEEITPRLQQIEQQAGFYASDAFATYSDLMALQEGNEL